jgi:hypothetical protein
MMRRLLPGLAIVVVAFAIAPSNGQAQRWSAEVQAGQIRSSLDPGAAAQNLALGIRLDDLNRNFNFSVGVPTGGSDPLWGALSAAQRVLWSRSSFVAGIDLAGNTYLLHQRSTQREVRGPVGPPQIISEPAVTGTAFAAQALPVVGFETTRWQLHARTGFSYYRNEFGDVERDRQVLLTDLQLTFTPRPTFAVMPVLRRYASEGEHFTYAGSSIVIASNAGNIWATGGIWPGLDNAEASWAAGATWQLHPRAAVSATGRHDGFDALYLNPPQTSWSIGFAVQIGGPSAVRAPVPAAYADGRATIRLDAGRARTRPMIAGDFTNWQPRPMQQAGNAWTYTTQLAPGVYNYAFVDANGKWFVPDDHPGRKDDGMGGSVAVLVVR